MLDKQYAVRAARCRHTAANEEVYETLRRITDPLTRSREKLAKANRIAIKFNNTNRKSSNIKVALGINVRHFGALATNEGTI